jgi:hypothetical protein
VFPYNAAANTINVPANVTAFSFVSVDDAIDGNGQVVRPNCGTLHSHGTITNNDDPLGPLTVSTETEIEERPLCTT